jgi:putative transposase
MTSRSPLVESIEGHIGVNPRQINGVDQQAEMCSAVAHLRSKWQDPVLVYNLDTRSTKRLQRLTGKRNRKIKHLLHVASRRLIDPLVDQGIETLLIGYNPNWKQQVRLGQVNNQKFVSIPHHKLVKMLRYKGPAGWHPGQSAR